MSSIYRDLKRAALLLKNANPEGYEIFLSQFNDLTLNSLKILSEASPDEILVRQGQCQQLRSLMRAFVECDKEKPIEPPPQ